MDRSTSFGTIAEDYDRYRPPAPVEVAAWLVPGAARRVADVCAGTGGFSRVLATRAEQVLAVDLDRRMITLAKGTPGVGPLCARGELLPIRSSSLDAVTVSSGWHWLDPELALPEIARVLRPGGVLGVVWNGPSRRVEWVGELLDRERSTRGGHSHGRRLEIPDGQPFSKPETRIVEWSLARTPSELVGLVATYSRFITLAPRQRRHLLRKAAELVESNPLLRGRARVDLPMSARCWKAVRLDDA